MIVSIFGCGWLGFPLAQRLIEKDFTVKGSTTSDKKLKLLKQNGIEPFKIELPGSLNNPETETFWDCDILFINIPPGRGTKNIDSVYPKWISEVVDKAKEHEVSWIIFASSTSVYSETGGITTEEDTDLNNTSRPSGLAKLKAENVIRESGIDYTILRFGGLYGYGRHPVNYLSGKKDLNSALKPVNLIHQVDCINVVEEVINQKARNEIYNVVSDGHPPRNTFYQAAARHFNQPKPVFLKDKSGKNYKVVSNSKLKSELKYTFSYPNPMDFTP